MAKKITYKDVKCDESNDAYNICCANTGITSLDGCSEEITGYFDCSGNRLVTLEGGPKIVEGNFDCSKNLLTSLKYSPK